MVASDSGESRKDQSIAFFGGVFFVIFFCAVVCNQLRRWLTCPVVWIVCRGSLFLGPPFEVTTNKMSFTTDVEKALANEQNEFKSPTELQNLTSSTFDRKFMEWLKQCNVKYDKQVE